MAIQLHDSFGPKRQVVILGISHESPDNVTGSGN